MKKNGPHLEKDSMGSVAVPSSARYGAQTQRALNNFTISTEPMPASFIKAILIIKQASAKANQDLGLLQPDKAAVIIHNTTKLLAEDLKEHFPVPVIQTGSGTSTNMNVNEVICSLAADDGIDLSPNDHVNMGQSSNDVIPSALHIAAALQIRKYLIPSLNRLSLLIITKSKEHSEVVKIGRTHLMDALPIRLHREMEGWAAQIDDCSARFESVLPRLYEIPLGGTAVGSGVNSHPVFS